MTDQDLLDKRDIAKLFRARLATLTERSGLSRARFAALIGVDRSALTQMLSPELTRLPRAETLIRIATSCGVSLDWLLGISQDEALSATIKPALEMEEAQAETDEALLSGWHREAAGTKIRYVPASIPDLFSTEAVITHQKSGGDRTLTSQIDMAHDLLETTRRLESDMEVCMPMQTLELLARGEGIWSSLEPDARISQLERMAQLTDELYPRFRLFLYDGRERFCAPYTVFGTQRAAVFVGEMYLVLNAADAIATLTRHFDQLIRTTQIHAHEASDWIGALRR